ncbi:MAG: hypothetical protein GY758_26510 [Fuerstiella sp.]|jgi:hypothetical protein|nr:hypothetical protein [Fuerstiella sp.]MCP4505779.1 hypothetical protein [Fuerstiella sp.]MDG2127568.1 hypothetical protein [Fuerstiella sp.]
MLPQIAGNPFDEQAADGSWRLANGNEGKLGATYTKLLTVLALTPACPLLPI